MRRRRRRNYHHYYCCRVVICQIKSRPRAQSFDPFVGCATLSFWAAVRVRSSDKHTHERRCAARAAIVCVCVWISARSLARSLGRIYTFNRCRAPATQRATRWELTDADDADDEHIISRLESRAPRKTLNLIGSPKSQRATPLSAERRRRALQSAASFSSVVHRLAVSIAHKIRSTRSETGSATSARAQSGRIESWRRPQCKRRRRQDHCHA